MKLLTHNILTCPKPACANAAANFPLSISIPDASAVEKDEEAEMNSEFVIGLPQLPETVPDNPSAEVEFLNQVHAVLMGAHVVTGTLTCPNCKREYPISDGIPNMLLSEDEVASK